MCSDEITRGEERDDNEFKQRTGSEFVEAGAEQALIHAVCSHGYGLVSDVEAEHEMEKTILAMRSCEAQIQDKIDNM